MIIDHFQDIYTTLVSTIQKAAYQALSSINLRRVILCRFNLLRTWLAIDRFISMLERYIDLAKHGCTNDPHLGSSVVTVLVLMHLQLMQQGCAYAMLMKN